MATTVARLQAVLDADTRGFDSKMKQSQTTTQKFGNVAKAALVGGVAAGLYAVGKAAQIGWNEYNQGAKVAAQTNAVIKSTGGVANVTAQQVEDLGHQLMLVSGVDDELIKSGENVLLTFKNVRNEAGKGNDVFTQATKAALDLSTALGTDLQSANIQIGKALNGSTTGLTALTRSGVSFTDKQKEMITSLFASGHALQAQKIILKELQVEFGGSAKAAGETFGGSLLILRERLNNFLGDLTAKAIPYLERLSKWLSPRITDALNTVGNFIHELQGDWRQLNAILQRHQETVSRVATVLGVLATALKLVARWNIFLYGTIIKVELAFLRVALTITDKVIGAIRAFVGAVRSIIGAVGRAAGAVVNSTSRMATAFRTLLSPIFTVISAVQRLIDLINAIPSVNPFRSENAGVPTGRGGSGGRVNPNRATGGPVFAGRSYTVGEHGPETFVPRVSGTIVPNGAGTINVILNGTLIDDRAGEKVVRMLEDWQRRGGRMP